MYDNYLMHYQILGAKHGIRRFQNPDGSLTPAGRERYGIGPPRSELKLKRLEAKKAAKEVRKEYKDFKKISEMSDEEMKRLTARMDQEEKYRKALMTKAKYLDELAKRQPSKFEELIIKGWKLIAKGAQQDAENMLVDAGKKASRSIRRSIADIFKEDDTPTESKEEPVKVNNTKHATPTPDVKEEFGLNPAQQWYMY